MAKFKISLGRARQKISSSGVGLFHQLRPTSRLKTRQGLLTVHNRDRIITPHLRAHGDFEFDYSLAVLRILKQRGLLPPTGGRLIDVGANIGMISIGLLLANEVEQAIAIEPDAANFRLLQKNIAQNGLLPRMFAQQLAAGAESGELEFELSNINTGDHRVRLNGVGSPPELHAESHRKTVRVKVEPLSRIKDHRGQSLTASSRPIVLWVDVQGFEAQVFEGCRDYLKTGNPTVAEIWPYGLLRAGTGLDAFAKLLQSIWSHYWVETDSGFKCEPIARITSFMENLSARQTDGFANVILTNGEGSFKS